jgi:hypothetical protein
MGFFSACGQAAKTVSALLAIDPLKQEIKQEVTAKNANRQEHGKRHRNLTGLVSMDSPDAKSVGALRLRSPERFMRILLEVLAGNCPD